MTLHALIGRDAAGHFSPRLTGQLRILGDRAQRFAIGALAQYKAEGFTEAGGEAEIGFLATVVSQRFHVDTNLILGLGVEEEEMGEADMEGKLRFGYDLVPQLRIGIMTQGRVRASGERQLAGGRDWDIIGGPEATASVGPLLLALSAGPSTVGVSDGVGSYAMLTIAGVSSF